MSTEPTSERSRSKRANGKQDKKLGPVLVSANRLAVHFGVVRQHVDQLAGQGVIERRPDGLFDQDQARLRYFTHLRTRTRSPRTEADAEHVRTKTQMLQLKLARESGELVRQEDVNDLIHKIVGITITGLSGLAARSAPPGDLVTRRNIERGVFELRKELARIGREMADREGEPPLDQQD